MPVDVQSSTSDVRLSTGYWIGYVLDRIAAIHSATELDDASAATRHMDLLYWTDVVIQHASFRLTDGDCSTVHEILTTIHRRLSSCPNVTATWLKRTARSLDADFADRLRLLSKRLYPPSAQPGYDPDFEIAFDEVVPASDCHPDHTNARSLYLDLKVDEKHGEVLRTGEKYRDPSCRAHFRIGSAEWHLFLAAYRAQGLGVPEEKVRAGCPGKRTKSALKQAKWRSNEKLRRLDVALEDKWPLRLVCRATP